MIGREGELRLVGTFLDGTGRGAHALLLHGEVGIGKTTIWHAALDTAAGRGHHVAVTRPTEAEARIPFAALNDLSVPDRINAETEAESGSSGRSHPAASPPAHRASRTALQGRRRRQDRSVPRH